MCTMCIMMYHAHRVNKGVCVVCAVCVCVCDGRYQNLRVMDFVVAPACDLACAGS